MPASATAKKVAASTVSRSCAALIRISTKQRLGATAGYPLLHELYSNFSQVMVVVKKRSASAALMDLSSSDDEPELPAAPVDNPTAKKRRLRSSDMPLFKPKPAPGPAPAAVKPAGVAVDVEFGDVADMNAQVVDVDAIEGSSDGEVVSVHSNGEEEVRKRDVQKGKPGKSVGRNNGKSQGNEVESESESESDDESDSDGEIDEPLDAGLHGQSEERKQVARLVASGGKDIAQHSARYFMMDNVVCSHCGVKGHLSYDCPEEADEKRCFLCGKPGHTSRACPDEACFYCNKTGHKQRNCPMKMRDASGGCAGPRPSHLRRSSTRRRIGPAHPTPLMCYVCGAIGHVDCSLTRPPRAAQSCCNCGGAGHAWEGCPEPPADRWVVYVNDLMRDRKDGRGRGGGRGGRGGRGGSRKTGMDAAAESASFKAEMCEAVRGGRGNFGGGANRSMRGRTWRHRR